MAELLAFLFCAATGFAMAGVVTSFYRLVAAEPADFLTAQSGVFANLVAVLLTMFGGPAIVMGKIVEGLRSGRLKPLPAVCGVVLVGMWSVCAGILFLGLLIAA